MSQESARRCTDTAEVEDGERWWVLTERYDLLCLALMKQDGGQRSSCGPISLTLYWLQPRLAQSKRLVFKGPDEAEGILGKFNVIVFFIVFSRMWWKTRHTDTVHRWFLQCWSSVVGMFMNALETRIILRKPYMFAEGTKTVNTYDDIILI